jgi:hypothetical protein
MTRLTKKQDPREGGGVAMPFMRDAKVLQFAKGNWGRGKNCIRIARRTVEKGLTCVIALDAAWGQLTLRVRCSQQNVPRP